MLLISEPAAGTGAALPPQQAELANRLLPNRGRVAALIETVVLDGSEETEESASADDGSDDVIDSEPAFDARWFQSVAPSRRKGGACAPLAIAGMVPASTSCPSSRRESILTAGAERWSGDDQAVTAPAAVAAARAAALERQRRTRPEARSDAERPAVAVAPAASPRDHGRRVSGGGSPGGSSAAAGLRIFAVSTLPLSLTAPVSFPTEPPPTFLPEGEPGVPPPASPG